MNISVISFTRRGDELNKRLCKYFGDSVICSSGKYFKERKYTLDEWTANAFENSDAIVFIGAAGIAVRSISGYIKSKATDPAVIAADDGGRFVIPLLSGHMGGANVLAEEIAEYIGAQAVITTSTDVNNVFAVDSWAVKNGYCVCNAENIKYISGALLDGKKVGLVSDFEVISALPCGVERSREHECGICISDKLKKPFNKTLNLMPKRYVIGVGSRRNAEENALIKLWNEIGKGIDKRSAAYVATIDIKKDESSVKRLAEYLGTDIRLYTTDELNMVEGDFEISEFVKRITGTDNVCERCAVAEGGRIITKKTKGDGVTAAVAVIDWSVSF